MEDGAVFSGHAHSHACRQCAVAMLEGVNCASTLGHDRKVAAWPVILLLLLLVCPRTATAGRILGLQPKHRPPGLANRFVHRHYNHLAVGSPIGARPYCEWAAVQYCHTVPATRTLPTLGACRDLPCFRTRLLYLLPYSDNDDDITGRCRVEGSPVY